MKLVDRLVVREVLAPLVNSIFMFLVVLFATAGGLFSLTELLMRGVSPAIVGRIGLVTLPMLVTQTLPMSMLLGCLLAFGRLSGDSEHVAVYAGGISFYRIIVPVAAMGLAVSMVAFAWDEVVVPPATRELVRLKALVSEEAVTKGKELFYTVKDPKTDHVDQVVIVYGGYDSREQTLKQVTIYKMDDDPRRRGQPAFVVHADLARPQLDDPTGVKWTYEGVRIQDLRYDPDRKNWPEIFLHSAGPEALLRSTGTNVGIDKTFEGVLQTQKRDNRTMTFGQLRDRIREERRAGRLNTLGDEVDLWEKVSTPLASLVFGLVGAPLGIRPQRGSKAVGFGVAVAIIFAYWVTYHWLYQIGKNGGLEPILASFAPNLIGVVAGVLLIARTRQ